MINLVDRTKATLQDVSVLPWLPDLTPHLTPIAWRSLSETIGLCESEYGTARVASGTVSAERDIVANLSLGHSKQWEVSIEMLTGHSAWPFKGAGVKFCAPSEILSSPVLTCLQEAFKVLDQVPGILSTVATLVRILHLIRSDDDQYDVSFSEPGIPFSIFVSVPRKSVPTGPIRVAEAILHEAMHLELSLIEKVVLLVEPSADEYFSPWRPELRPARGILHGLFVFRAIDQFLETLAPACCHDRQLFQYIVSRRYQIADQIAPLQYFQDSQHLTPIGADWVCNLFTAFRSNRSGEFSWTARARHLSVHDFITSHRFA